MDDWTGVATAVAAVGTFVIAVVALSSSLVSRAINKQGEQIEKYEANNGKEHARLEAKIDSVSGMLQEVRDIVIRLDDRQGEDRKRQQAAD